MNKQELVKAVIELPVDCSGPRPKIDKLTTLELIKLLDEPQKPVIPQFVADFIAKQKKLGHTLSYSIDASMSDIVAEWYWDNSELFAQAWIFGYEVEEEKRYLVKVKGMNEECEYLVFGELSNTWKFRGLNEFGELKKHHTRKQLEEAGFGWVFDCPGIEIEEVKE